VELGPPYLILHPQPVILPLQVQSVTRLEVLHAQLVLRLDARAVAEVLLQVAVVLLLEVKAVLLLAALTEAAAVKTV
jgi:hypothetical protein